MRRIQNMLPSSELNDSEPPIQQPILHEDRENLMNSATVLDPLKDMLDPSKKEIDPTSQTIDLNTSEMIDSKKKPDLNASMDDFLKNIWTSDDHHTLVSLESPVQKHESMSRLLNSGVTEEEEDDDDDDYDDNDDDTGGHSWRNNMVATDLIDSGDNILRHDQLLQPARILETAMMQQPAKTEDGDGEVTLEDFMRSAGLGAADVLISPTILSESANAARLEMYNAPIGGSTDRGNAALSAPAMESIAPQYVQSDWLKFADRFGPMQMQIRRMQQSAVKNEMILPSSGNVLGGGGGGGGGGATMYESINADLRAGFGERIGLSQGLISQPYLPALGVSPSAISEFNYPSMHGRKRTANESVMEKTVERRQRRMIKNRESAARSRAKKQAYTTELEAEVAQLKEENARLRQEQASISGSSGLKTSESKIASLQRAHSW